MGAVSYTIKTFNPEEAASGALCIVLNYTQYNNIGNNADVVGGTINPDATYIDNIDNQNQEVPLIVGTGICKRRGDLFTITINSTNYTFNSDGTGYSGTARGKYLYRCEVVDSTTVTNNVTSTTNMITRAGDGTISTGTLSTAADILIENLTARDEFAAQALRGILGRIDNPSVLSKDELKFYCDAAYKWAEGMLQEAAKSRAVGAITPVSGTSTSSYSDNTEALLAQIASAIGNISISSGSGGSIDTTTLVAVLDKMLYTIKYEGRWHYHTAIDNDSGQFKFVYRPIYGRAQVKLEYYDSNGNLLPESTVTNWSGKRYTNLDVEIQDGDDLTKTYSQLIDMIMTDSAVADSEGYYYKATPQYPTGSNVTVASVKVFVDVSSINVSGGGSGESAFTGPFLIGNTTDNNQKVPIEVGINAGYGDDPINPFHVENSGAIVLQNDNNNGTLVPLEISEKIQWTYFGKYQRRGSSSDYFIEIPCLASNKFVKIELYNASDVLQDADTVMVDYQRYKQVLDEYGQYSGDLDLEDSGCHDSISLESVGYISIHDMPETTHIRLRAGGNGFEPGDYLKIYVAGNVGVFGGSGSESTPTTVSLGNTSSSNAIHVQIDGGNGSGGVNDVGSDWTLIYDVVKNSSGYFKFEINNNGYGDVIGKIELYGENGLLPDDTVTDWNGGRYSISGSAISGDTGCYQSELIQHILNLYGATDPGDYLLYKPRHITGVGDYSDISTVTRVKIYFKKKTASSSIGVSSLPALHIGSTSSSTAKGESADHPFYISMPGYLPLSNVGVQNGKVLRLEELPGYDVIKANSNYNQDYNRIDGNIDPDDYSDEAYFKGLVRWAITEYLWVSKSDSSNITLIGSARPNSTGTVHIDLYGGSGRNPNADDPTLPMYCSGMYLTLSGTIFIFGTIEGAWYWRQINSASIDAASLGGVAAANYATQSWVNNQGHVASASELKNGNTTIASATSYGLDVNGIANANSFTIEETDERFLIELYEHGVNSYHVQFWGDNGNDSPTPPDYYSFDSEVRATAFKKTGSSNDYVLLGGGGTKAVIDFATWMDRPVTARGLNVAGDSTMAAPHVRMTYDYVSAGRFSMNFTGYAGDNMVAPISYIFDAPVTQSSDIRLKDIIRDEAFDAESIAKMPLVTYSWKKDEEKREHFGTIAQNWEKVIPEVVIEGGDGMKAMDYGAAAMAAGVTACREIVELKEENKELKKTVEYLKKELEAIKEIVYGKKENDMED